MITIPRKAYLRPDLVHRACQELIQEMEQEGRPSVTLEDVAAKLSTMGVRNPRTQKAPSRQAILDILTAPGNKVGHKLHEKLVGSQNLTGRVQIVA